MIFKQTRSPGRGTVIAFQDSKNTPCYIQHSSCIEPSIWIGIYEQPVAMHLSQDQVKGIIPMLFNYAYTGELKMNAKLYYNVFFRYTIRIYK